MSDEDKEIEIAYKKAITDFLEEGGQVVQEFGNTLKAVAVELRIFNRNLPGLLDEMKLLRGAIDRMPRR